MKKCSIEECSNKVWSKGLCLKHSPKTPLRYKKKAISKYSAKGLEKKKAKTENTKKLHSWFLEVWDAKEKLNNGFIYCQECGGRLKREIYRENICCYSHILPKSKYKNLAMMDWNIFIVHPDCHALYENGSEKAIRQRAYKEHLLSILENKI